MAYKGFLATEELFEIDNDGDPDNGSWVIPIDRADEFPDDVFLKEEGLDGQERRVRYQEGDFVFRLSGRDRQRSASYYTPEVLTEFTVRHTLDVYWEEHPDLTAADILKLTVCEPALGSGAFLNEAINQLAARYVKAAQDETGETIDPDRYQLELQKAKAHFAINQAYGVDLNPTAVELAEVSLWLNCMHEGLKAPRFGARLRRGNSLIGARRATYTVEQIKKQPWKDTTKSPAIAPTDQPLHEVPLGRAAGIHHFLLPGEGWGAAADAVELKGKGGKRPVQGLAEEWCQAVRSWRTAIHKVPNKTQLDRLGALSNRVEAAWETAASDATDHHRAHTRRLDLWGASVESLPDTGTATSTRFNDPEGPAARLRLLMDAWCSLWMWAPANGNQLPSLDDWLDAIELLLGQPAASERDTLFSTREADGDRLKSVELFGKAAVEEILDRNPWLRQCQGMADAQAFFHWELAHPGAFLANGFDIQVGNPPWLRPRWDEPGCLAEHDPWWGVTDLTKASEELKKVRRSNLLRSPHAVQTYVRDRSELEALNALLGSGTREPILERLQTNLYMVFMTNTWRRRSAGGVVGLLHPESHFVDPKAGSLRAAAYRRLRRHWQFANELFLFEDVHHVTEFGVNAYAEPRSPDFLQAVNLLAPGTLDRSLVHDGTGAPPSIQYPEGGWDLRPHRERIVRVNGAVLAGWVSLFDESGTSPEKSRLIRPLTDTDARALTVFSNQAHRLSDFMRHWTRGIDEDKLKREGTAAWHTETPPSLVDCILQGPHVLNATPLGQQPRPDCRNNTDWESVDLETLPEAHVPCTNYKRSVDRSELRLREGDWDDGAPSLRFRETHREFVGSGSERTLQACILPPGPTHVNALVSMDFGESLPRIVGLLAALPMDYLVKVGGVSHLNRAATDHLPIPAQHQLLDRALVLRALRLNCVTRDYAPLWIAAFSPTWTEDAFVAGEGATTGLGHVAGDWTSRTPLRVEYDRWLAACEIDAIAAHLLGLSEDQLLQMYRSQFAVLRKYESQMVFDDRGRQICGDYHAHGYRQAEWEAALKRAPVKRGERRIRMWDRIRSYLAGDTTIDLGPFVPPFRPADREAAMRRAYRAFAERLEAAQP